MPPCVSGGGGRVMNVGACAVHSSMRKRVRFHRYGVDAFSLNARVRAIERERGERERGERGGEGEGGSEGEGGEDKEMKMRKKEEKKSVLVIEVALL